MLARAHVNHWSTRPTYWSSGSTLASTIANEFTEATGEMHTAALTALGLVLFVITFGVLAIARLLLLRQRYD